MKKLKIFCNQCKSFTNHTVLSSYTKEDTYTEEQEVSGEMMVSLIENYTWINSFCKCNGCESSTLMVEFISAYSGEPEENWNRMISYFPERTETKRKYRNYVKLPIKFKRIYYEIILSINSNCLILSGIGIRALIEGICNDKNVEGSDLKGKISNLNKILPENIVDSLHSLRFVGNIAVHKLSPPKHSDLVLAIDIIEDILNFLYDLEYRALKLKKNKMDSM